MNMKMMQMKSRSMTSHCYSLQDDRFAEIKIRNNFGNFNDFKIFLAKEITTLAILYTELVVFVTRIIKNC